MTIDLSVFHAVFFEEVTEHLAEIEQLIINLNIEAPNPDTLNAIFRAAHSIKGGSGTFGFNDMTELTHILESVLDRLRNSEILLTHEMIDVFLSAADVINDQLNAHRNNQIIENNNAKAIIARLQKFMEELPNELLPTVPINNTTDQANFAYQWRLNFVPAAINEAAGINSLLDEWGQRGILNIKHRPNPSDPDQIWEIHFFTNETSEDLREDLTFYVDSQHIQIEQIAHEESSIINNDNNSFGFFDNAPGAPQTSLANFASQAANTNNISPAITKIDEAYGFFTNAPGAPAEVNVKKTDEAINQVNNRKSEGSSIRVSVEKVDQIMNLVGELVIAQSMLAQVASQIDPNWTARMQAGLDQLARNTRNLQESVMSIRMMPISVVFSRFPRLVRDLAAKLEKRVELITVGEGTELDKGLTEKLIDPLTHLVRNSLDHGIELPATRVKLGKEPVGHIIISASHQSGNVVIEVSDDGAGLNRELIIAKARERGFTVNEGMSDQEVWQFIFSPGFSTAEQVTDVSGRGVGMDVVRRNIQEMGGTIDITSMPGIGSTFTVRLPLTLAILDGLSVAVGNQIFIISLSYIMESMRPLAKDIRTISSKGQVVQVRGEYLPVLALYEVLGITPTVSTPEEGILVLLEAENRRVALFVDQLVGQHQVVIKSLESNFRRVDGISGATIMGDGRVALILDVGYLVRRTARASSSNF